MKIRFAFFLLILFYNYSNSQSISGKVLDSITRLPLDLASVTFLSNQYSVFTDSKGEFTIDKMKVNDYLRLSYIGYETKVVKLSDFQDNKAYSQLYFLVPKAKQLNEVIISSKKMSYGAVKSIKANRKKSQSFGFQFGSENCTLIANPQRKKGRVETIAIDLKKTAEFNKDIPEWKLDYFATFSIKFYSFDSKNNRPGEEVYGKEIIVEPQNKSYKLIVNVDSLNIPFPQEGLCVGVEIINTKYNNPKKVFAIIAPSINFVECRSFRPIMAWMRYRNEDWKFKTPLSQDQEGKKYYMMIVDAVVKFEK